MSDFLRVLGEWIQYIWPFRKVTQWERGLFYKYGRFVREVGPGIYPVLPWFHDVKAESVVKGIAQTPRIDITLKDGRLLVVQASAVVQVVDLNLAVNTVEAYMETSVELITAVIADKIADVEADRLAPEKRRRLISDLLAWIQKESDFGVDVSKLRFTTFVLNPRPYRLLGDNSAVTSW